MAGGGIITTGNHPKAQWPGVKEWFGAKYDEHEEEYSQLFDVIPSSQGWEEDVLHSGFGLAPVKEQGKSVTYASHAQGYVKRYVPAVVALGYIVTREEIDDNLYEKVSNQRAESLAFSMRQTKENIHANIFNRAFNSSYPGGDGKELIASDHPSKGGDWSNILDPAADISEQAIEDICIQIMGATDEEGLNISIMPYCLAVPRQLWFESNRILKSTLQNDSALNALNVLKSTNAIPQGVKINHYFTDADAFFIKTNAPNGLKCYMRRNIEFTRDNDFDTENAKAKATERYIPGWSDPRCLYASPGA